MNRVPRVEQAIQEIVAGILQQEMKDPRVALVTVTRVRATADLQHAVVYFSALGEGSLQTVEEALKRATPYVRRLLATRLRLRVTPELRFQYDPSIEEGIRLEKRFREVGTRATNDGHC